MWVVRVWLYSYVGGPCVVIQLCLLKSRCFDRRRMQLSVAWQHSSSPATVELTNQARRGPDDVVELTSDERRSLDDLLAMLLDVGDVIEAENVAQMFGVNSRSVDIIAVRSLETLLHRL